MTDWDNIIKNLPKEQRVSFYLIKKLVDLKVITEDQAFGVIGDGLGDNDVRKKQGPRKYRKGFLINNKK